MTGVFLWRKRFQFCRMAKQEDPLYFVAIVPPSPVLEEGQELKEYFKERYQSKASLNSPPHITLHMPFKWRDLKKEKLIAVLEQLADGHSPFKIELKGFGAFTPRVIYIGVEQKPALMNLQKDVQAYFQRQLKLMNANHKQKAFHPHITLAFRDLRKVAFYEAWQEFKERQYQREIMVEEIVLFKHDGKRWLVDKKFPLAGQS